MDNRFIKRKRRATELQARAGAANLARWLVEHGPRAKHGVHGLLRTGAPPPEHADVVERDPEAFRREFGAEFLEAASALLPSEAVDACVARGERVEASSGHDDKAVCVAVTCHKIVSRPARQPWVEVLRIGPSLDEDRGWQILN